jgi:hypothetical protein
MGTGARLAGTVAVLGTVFALAWGAGAATAPQPPPPPPIDAPVDEAPTASRVALVGGYRVRLDGDLVPGVPSQVFATVTRDGVAVTDLEPHLGGFGHLVALRLEDLTLLRVLPNAPPPAPTGRSGPGIAFTTGVPVPGTYRLYLEFVHVGAVHTATFTIPAREVS